MQCPQCEREMELRTEDDSDPMEETTPHEVKFWYCNTCNNNEPYEAESEDYD